MSTNLQELTRSFTAVVCGQVKKNFQEIGKQMIGNNESGMSQFNLLLGWLDQAIQQVGAGAANLNVPLAGQPTGSIGSPAPVSGLGGPNPLANIVANSGSPLGGGFTGGSPLGGGFTGGHSPLNPAVAAGVPSGVTRSLAELGRCRVPTHERTPDGKPPAGIKCGAECTKKDFPGQVFFCAAKATTANATSGLWSCGSHKNRGVEPRGVGKKKSGPITGTPISSAQQVQGLRTATNVPVAFIGNSPMGNQLSNIMGQTPQPATPNGVNPLTGVPMAGQMTPQINPVVFGQPSPSNNALSNQLMNSVSSQVGTVQPVQVAPSGAGINMNNLMNSTPTSVPISVGSSKSMFDEDDGGSGSDDETEEEVKIETVNHNDLARALAGAQTPQSNPFGGQPVQQNSFPVNQTPQTQNPLANALNNTQQPPAQQVNQVPQDQSPLAQALNNTQQVNQIPQDQSPLANALNFAQQAPAQQVQQSPVNQIPQNQNPLAQALNNTQQAPAIPPAGQPTDVNALLTGQQPTAN